MSKRLGSPYRSGRVAHWLKIKNPAAPAITREAEEDWPADPRPSAARSPACRGFVRVGHAPPRYASPLTGHASPRRNLLARYVSPSTGATRSFVDVGLVSGDVEVVALAWPVGIIGLDRRVPLNRSRRTFPCNIACPIRVARGAPSLQHAIGR